MPALDFFIGKGGVGKTTISAAYACLQAARSGGRVLLLSTDPAHSLFDVLELQSSRERKTVQAGRGEVVVWQLDAQREFGGFLNEYRDAVLEVLASGTMFSREEIAPLLDSSIPGMAEVSALLVLADLLRAGQYERIVVDTAPMGHTLRLFELPETFLRLLRLLELAARRDRILAERFAGTTLGAPKFLREWMRRAEEIHDALSGSGSRIVLVTTPEEFAINESLRAAESMRGMSPPLRVREIVLNRAALPTSTKAGPMSGAAGSCPRCMAAAKRTQAAKIVLRRKFADVKLRVAEDAGAPVAGAEALLALGENVFAGKRRKLAIDPPHPSKTGLGGPPGKTGQGGAPQVRLSAVEWPKLDTALALTIGKGGVGKTTISAALGYVARQPQPSQNRARVGHPNAREGHPSDRVTIFSTDPAPSLDDVFRKEVGEEPVSVLGDSGLQAMEIDAAAEFRRWSEAMKEKVADAFGGNAGGVHVDLSFEREMITALLDMAPPGIDELAATFRIPELLGDRRDASATVVLDMAPTGHALELLRMPQRIQVWTRLLLRALAPQRQLSVAQNAAVEIAKIGQEARRLATMLTDEKQCRAYVVMLAEPLPDRETGRLIRALGDLGIARGPVIVNRVLGPEAEKCGRCRRRRRFQMATLARLRREELGTLLAVEESPSAVAGAAALKKITRKIWRVE